jgi:hypothetical protein
MTGKKRSGEGGECRRPDRREFLQRAGQAAATIVGGLLLKSRPATAGPVTKDQYGDMVQTVRRGELPEFARGVPDTGSLYRFATDHAADLQYIPCFCGCKSIGHGSNRECYIKSFNRDGTVTYTSHGST